MIIANGTCGTTLYWELDGNGVLIIYGSGDMSDYPNGVAPWHSYTSQILKISLPQGLTSIGDFAFYGCTNATGALAIPQGVTSIGASAFQGCTGLTGSLCLPSSLETLKTAAFQGCTGFTGSLNLPVSIQSMGPNVFEGCIGITSVQIPNNTLTSLPQYTFKNCTGLVSINLPYGLQSLGAYSFLNCTSLAHLSWPSTLQTVNTRAFMNCTSLEEIVFPANVYFYGSTFIGCTSLTSILFTGAYNNVNTESFALGTADSPVTCTVRSPGNIAYGYFNNAKNDYTTFIYISAPSGTCGPAMNWIFNDDSHTLYINGSGDMRNSLHGGSPWYGYASDIQSISISEGVESIGQYAFENCAVINITFPSSLSTLRAHSFDSCTNLTTLSIPTTIQIIGGYTFTGCVSLITLTLHSISLSIGTDAFSLGTQSDTVGCTVYSPNNLADNILEDYKGAYTTFTYVSLPAPPILPGQLKIKSDGAWILANKIYTKINGVWVESTSSYIWKNKHWIHVATSSI